MNAYNNTRDLQHKYTAAQHDADVREYNRPGFFTIVIDGLAFLMLGAGLSFLLPQVIAAVASILFR